MNFLENAKQIHMLVMDVDGVLTDGLLFFNPDGEELKAFHAQDGHGIKMWHQAGGLSAIITGRQNHLVEHRARNLGIHHLIQGREDKGTALEELSAISNVPMHNMAYIGDDFPDLSAFRRCGLAIAVANAHVSVRERAHFVTKNAGGHAAVREVCDLLLQSREQWDVLIEHYWNN